LKSGWREYGNFIWRDCLLKSLFFFSILEQNKNLLDEKQKTTESADAVIVYKQQIETLEKDKAAFAEKAEDLETRLASLEV